jgi:hypothetical protein
VDVLVKVILLADAVSLRGHVEARTLHMPTDSFASPSHGLDARLDQLSRDLATERRRRRRLEKGVLALALIAISAGTIAATSLQTASEVVRTKRLEIVDENGRIVALAAAAKHGGRIDLWDDAGTNSARLGGNGTGGDLALWNRAGEQVVAAYADGTAGRLEVNTKGGAVGVAISADDRGGLLTVSDGNGESAAEVRCGTDGGEFAAITAGQDTALLAARNDGGRLTLLDANGRESAKLMGTGRLDLLRDRQVQTSLVATQSGGGLRLSAPSGQVRITADASLSGGLVQTHDLNDVPVVAIGSGEGGSGIRVRNSDAVSVAAIGVDGNGHGAIEVSSLSGDRCGSLVVGESGGKLFLGNNEGKPFIEAGGDSDGGLMQVYDRNMKVAATIQGLGEGGRIAVGIASKGIGGSIEARGDGPAALSIFGPGGRSVAIAAGQNGGLINLLDIDGGVAFAAGAATDGPGGVMAIQNEKGAQVIRVGVNARGNGEIEVYDASATRKRKISAP